MTTLGYARVSTNDQDLSGQLTALKAAGAEKVCERRSQGHVQIGLNWAS
jgi:DNA invertase Pin-like site-specific DNA recombinase